ncbi:MAG: hypothetical protein IJJ14_01615, partial [Coriobacteriales bacterium]|nr:hypothetical protein [Coriobacteriales bacterium]
MAKRAAQATAAPLPPSEAASRPRGSSAYIGMVTVGFGLYLAWQNILMNPSLVPPANPGFSVGNWFYLQDVLFLALLALGCAIARKRATLPHRIPIFWVAAAIMAVGTL